MYSVLKPLISVPFLNPSNALTQKRSTSVHYNIESIEKNPSPSDQKEATEMDVFQNSLNSSFCP